MKRFHTRVPAGTPNQNLDEYLSQWLSHLITPELSRSKIRQMILMGAVFVNRHREKKPKAPVGAGAVVEVYYDERKLGASSGEVAAQQYRISRTDILYEDDYLIAINKPSGLPTQPTLDPLRSNLYDLLVKYRAENPSATGGVYVGLHHRLDKDTSGIVLFTKKEEANVGVSQLFSEHKIEKAYHALVWKTPWVSSSLPTLSKNSEFFVENYLGKISSKNETSKYGKVSSGGDFARTDFKVVEAFSSFLWLEARPKTGRTHQIRVHCSEMGLPILGDPLYFPSGVIPMVQVPRLMLHAFSLKFEHPIKSIGKGGVGIESPLPAEFLAVLQQGRK